MKTIKMIAYARNISDTELIIYSQHIHNTLLGNGNFNFTIPSLTDLQLANIVLDDALVNQSPGDTNSTGQVRAASRQVKRVLKAMAAHVDYAAFDNETLALSSGFSIKKPAVKDAKTFTAKQGKTSGTVNLYINSYGNAAYMWEVSADPIGQWKTLETTVVSKTTVNGFTPGNKYWFRVAVVTSKGKNDYSDPHVVHVV